MQPTSRREATFFRASNESLYNFHPFQSVKVENEGEVINAMGKEVVDDFFAMVQKKEQSFYNKLSSSECDDTRVKLKAQATDDDLDPRLKAWKTTLRQRQALQKRIQRKTGKRAEDVLFNEHVTIDNQAKVNIMAMLDASERIDGKPPDYVRPVLPTRLDPQTCREIREVPATDPKFKVFEFVGLPNVSKVEMIGAIKPEKSSFLQSQALENRLETDYENIERVMEYFPKLEQLQVAPSFEPPVAPVLDSNLLYEDHLLNVSSITATSEPNVASEDLQRNDYSTIEISESSSKEDQTANIIKVNGQVYGFGDMSGEMSGKIQLNFKCDPFQRVRKTIVHLENVGKKFIQLKWQQNSLYNKALNQQLIYNLEFVFDSQPFILEPKQMRTIDVLYQPCAVGIKKQSWSLLMHRSSFCGMRRMDISFHGHCTVPAAYSRRLKNEVQLCVDKRLLQVTNRLARMHAELVPIIEPQHMLCPYDRPLDERELFAALNPGFKCERYADLEALREFYVMVKKPRQPPWDYVIESVRQCVYQHDAAQREVLQKVLLSLIEPMRCNMSNAFEKFGTNDLRDRSCFIYVRGVINSAIEDWEALSENLEQQYFKAELQRYFVSREEDKKKMKNKETMLDDNAIDALIMKKVQTNKYFKDTLYIQTYTLLCDAGENIVSAIESTINL